MVIVIIKAVEVIAFGLHSDVNPRRVAEAQLQGPHVLLVGQRRVRTVWIVAEIISCTEERERERKKRNK